jgi:riboflavin synthase
VTLDGISLTINRVDEAGMSIRIVPHTYRETRLQALSTGDRVNLEVDMLARYVYNIVNNDR